MSAPGTVVVWICAALAALPLSPCALISSVCRLHQQPAQVDVDAEPVRSCCARQEQPAREKSQPNRTPCKGDCCRSGPFVPTGEKLVPASQPVALLAVLPLPDDLSSGVMAPLTIEIARPLSWHILHCQWRC